MPARKGDVFRRSGTRAYLGCVQSKRVTVSPLYWNVTWYNARDWRDGLDGGVYDDEIKVYLPRELLNGG